MKPASEYQRRINRKKMRDEALAVLAVTAVIHAVVQIVVGAMYTRYAETIVLPWEAIQSGIVAVSSAVALALLCGERDKDQFDRMKPTLAVLFESLASAARKPRTER